MKNNMKNEEGEMGWIERFNKEFTVSHSGDSGIGGNEPQEPVYQICVDDPKEFISFISELLQSQKSKLEKEILEKMPREIEPDMKSTNIQAEVSYCAGFGNCLQEVKEIITSVTSVFKEK